jgi:YVTN family beta-propeller protein
MSTATERIGRQGDGPAERKEYVMKRSISMFPAIATFTAAAVLGSAPSMADVYAYMTNSGSNSVLMIKIYQEICEDINLCNARGGGEVVATIRGFNQPWGVAVSRDGNTVYVTNKGDNTVSVVDAYNKKVTDKIPVGSTPEGVAVTSDGSSVYVANENDNTVSVIDTVKKSVVATITLPAGTTNPYGVAVGPQLADNSSNVYVTNAGSANVSVINTKSNQVTTTIPVGSQPLGVDVHPDGRVYVANYLSGNVSVIHPASNTVTTTPLPSGSGPVAVAVRPSKDLKSDRVWVSDKGTGEISIINTANDKVNHHFSVAAGHGCAPFGLAGTDANYYVGNISFFKARELLLWVALEGDNCNAIGEFGAAEETGHRYAFIHSQDTVNPVALGKFIGPQPTPPGITAQSAPPTGDPCSGPFDGTVNGDLTVSDGETCEVVNGGQVTGNVTVTAGGNFTLTGAAVGGSITVDGGSVTLGPAATVGGDVMIENLPAGGTSNVVCGITVEGTLQVDGNASPVQVGSSGPSGCAGNKIGGDLVVDGNSAQALVFDNRVTGALQANSNTGPLDVVGNTVGTTLQCQNNTMLVMGGNNTARQTIGQCH